MPVRIEQPTDLDWYLDNVVVPSGIERRPIGPVRAWQGSWEALAARLERDADEGPTGEVTRRALTQGFVVTRAQALVGGLTTADLRRAAAQGSWTRCGHGVLAVTAPEDDDHFGLQRRHHALVAAGSVLRRTEHVIAGASAAILHGLPVRRVPDQPDLIARHDTTTGRRSAARVLHPSLAADQVELWFGAPVTTMARTVLDLARLDPRSGLMAADAALHESVVRETDLRRAVDAAVGFRWIRRAREVLALASPLIESPLESLTQLALHDSGFPPPRLQARLRGADGRVYRVDFFWPEAGLILEADGRGKYRTDQLWAEKKRERALARAGYRVERVVWDDIVRTWPATRVWLWAALTARTR